MFAIRLALVRATLRRERRVAIAIVVAVIVAGTMRAIA